MTSNEGIYSFGVCGQKGPAAKQPPSANRSFKVDTGITVPDSNEAESSKIENSESSERPAKELLCLEKLELTRDGDFQEDRS